MNQKQSMPFLSVVDGQYSSLQNISYNILSENLKLSKLSFYSNVFFILLILLSTIEIILSSSSSNTGLIYLKVIDYTTGFIFLIETICRIIYAPLLTKNKSALKSRLSYIFSIYGLIDILSIIPFIGTLAGFSISISFKMLRIVRLWKIVRFIPAFGFINSSLQKKGDEILVSLLGVFLLSTTLSTFIYFVETEAGSTSFTGILHALIWSIGKYTGDYGGFAGEVPVTDLGKFLATVNGFLGIALFAVPAGLIGSAFIDEMSEQKKQKEIHARIDDINLFFDSSYAKNKSIDNKMAYWRYIVFQNLQARLLYSDEEILESIRNSENLRFRTLKSADHLKYHDTKLIERFDSNRSYGCLIEKPESNLYIINPMGGVERCISHFNYTIADNLGLNFISREKRIYIKDYEELGANYSEYYADFEKKKAEGMPELYNEFMNDILKMCNQDIALVICTGKSGRADIILEYGNKKGFTDLEEGVSTFKNQELLNNFEQNLKELSSGIEIICNNAAKETFSFSYENHGLGNYNQNWVGKTIHRLTGAQVITIYLNVAKVTGDDNVYYALMNVLMKSIEMTFLSEELK
jgi:voltage-gated potassium channel